MPSVFTNVIDDSIYGTDGVASRGDNGEQRTKPKYQHNCCVVEGSESTSRALWLMHPDVLEWPIVLTTSISTLQLLVPWCGCAGVEFWWVRNPVPGRQKAPEAKLGAGLPWKKKAGNAVI